MEEKKSIYLYFYLSWWI